MKLEIRYRINKTDEWHTEEFEFDEKKYRNERNNHYNVVSDYLQDKFGKCPCDLNISIIQL